VRPAQFEHVVAAAAKVTGYDRELPVQSERRIHIEKMLRGIIDSL
jgi:hypothetical protein